MVGGLPGTIWLGLCLREVGISGECDLGDSHSITGDSFFNGGGSISSSKGGSMWKVSAAEGTAAAGGGRLGGDAGERTVSDGGTLRRGLVVVDILAVVRDLLLLP